MQTLVEKIRKAREKAVEAGGYKFTIRRPTDMEITEMYGQDGRLRQSEVLQHFVVGWDGVTELDLIPGGTGEPVPFDSNTFVEWVADKPDLWAPLTEAITDAYQHHSEQLENTKKKPPAG